MTFRLADHIVEEYDDEEDRPIHFPFFYCEHCDNVGDAIDTVAHSEDCVIGEIVRLQKCVAELEAKLEEIRQDAMDRDLND